MSVEFCGFVDSDDNVIAVNPLQVRCVRSGAPGFSVIEFDSDHSIKVKGTVTQVKALLTNGEHVKG